MHLGLNLIFLVPGETGGMEVAARALIPELVRLRPDWRFTAFVNREAGPEAWPELGETVVLPIRATRRPEWVLAEQSLLPVAAGRRGVDLVHSLASTGPAVGRFKHVVTVHDLIYRVHPEAHFGLRARAMAALVPLAARRADRVIVPSQATCRDAVEHLGLPSARVDVIPNGVGVPDTADGARVTAMRARLALGDRRVLLTASAKRPHKNIAGLLDALALIPPAGRPVLVASGYPTPHEIELRARASSLGLTGDVRWLNWVDAADMEALWALADAFVFPSYYEGFGLPILEAMIREVPVACSNRSALPEVAGSAALLFDPDDPRAIADAVRALLAGGRRIDALVAGGRRQAERFGWRTAAEATLRSYQRARAEGRC